MNILHCCKYLQLAISVTMADEVVALEDVRPITKTTTTSQMHYLCPDMEKESWRRSENLEISITTIIRNYEDDTHP